MYFLNQLSGNIFFNALEFISEIAIVCFILVILAVVFSGVLTNIFKTPKNRSNVDGISEEKLQNQIKKVDQYIIQQADLHEKYTNKLEAQINDNKSNQHLGESFQLIGEEVKNNLQIVIDTYEKMIQKNIELRDELVKQLDTLNFLKRTSNRQPNTQLIDDLKDEQEVYDEFTILAELQKKVILTEEINNKLSKAEIQKDSFKAYKEVLLRISET